METVAHDVGVVTSSTLNLAKNHFVFKLLFLLLNCQNMCDLLKKYSF